tara:strand:+ start:554 stop:748 length:195 start_codon:yes stop_codon:yes gene_type:complete
MTYIKFGEYKDMTVTPVWIKLLDETFATVGDSNYHGNFDLSFNTKDLYFEWSKKNVKDFGIPPE